MKNWNLKFLHINLIVKITQIDFQPIGVGRDFLLPFLSRKKGESNSKLSNDPSQPFRIP
jgi:hypothetical protein